MIKLKFSHFTFREITILQFAFYNLPTLMHDRQHINIVHNCKGQTLLYNYKYATKIGRISPPSFSF